MVNILNNTEKDILVNSISSFYDLSTCSQLCGNEIIINLSKKLGEVVYSDLRYTTFDKKEIQLYFRKEKLLIGIILELFLNFQEIYVYNYGDQWIKNKKTAPSLNQILKNNKVFDRDCCVLKLTEKAEIVAFAKSIFRYNTFVSFFNPTKDIVVTPTDHLDIFISSKDEHINAIKEIIENKNENKIFNFSVQKSFLCSR